MHLKYIKILALLLLGFTPFIKAQDNNAVKSLGLISPNVADFIRYGNIDLPNAAGEFVMDIPLYEYRDKDFSIPIHMKYGSSGFKPSQLPTNVGLHWHLATGGVITRTVNGSADDTKGKDSQNDEDHCKID